MPAPVLPIAFIESLGGGELMMVLLIALLLFGGDKLPELARSLGKSMREFKKVTGTMQDELKKAMEEVEAPPPTILPPRPASPEIKSTPGLLPPGAEGPPGPFTEDPPYADDGSDPYVEYPPAPTTDAPVPTPAPTVDPVTPPAPLAADPLPSIPPENPEPRPSPGLGPVS